MAALKGGIRQVGQIAQHRQAGLPFQHGSQQSIQMGGAVIEQDARQMAGGTELFQPVDLGRQRQAGPSGLDHQQHRQAQRIGQMPCTGGIAHAAQSITVSGAEKNRSRLWLSTPSTAR